MAAAKIRMAIHSIKPRFASLVFQPKGAAIRVDPQPSRNGHSILLNLKVVTFNDRTALCIYGQTMIMTGKNGMQMFGQEPCPDGPTTKAFAVVNIEHPIFVWVGFLSLFLGFVIQVFAVPRPQTEAMMRAELKLLKAQQGQAKPL
jgi:hypothetical protein